MDALSVGAVHAAEQVAQAHGIKVDTTEVVADGSNLLVHLKPAPLLARVATTTALLRRPISAWLGRDVSVAAYLHAQGAPVAPPTDLLSPGPHLYDGYTMSFWQWVEHDRAAEISTGEAGAMLRDLHQTLRGYRPLEAGSELPLLEIFNEITRWLKFLEGRRALSGGELIQLRETHWRLAETLRYGGRAVQPIHGDANRKNLLKTEKGWLWTDFEDACGGATAWDIACLVRTAPEGIDAALASYPGAPTLDELLPYLRARELEAVVYWQLQAQRFPERQAEAHGRLREWQRRQPHSGAFGQ
jgi:Phosphotransferase enzyme family